MNLSERQKNILRFIAAFIAENNFPPTIREIGQACNISSTSVVKYNLNKLERYGLIVRHKEVSRGLSLNWPRLEETGVADDLNGSAPKAEENGSARFGFFQVPILGRIAAGEPIQVEPADRLTADEWIELNQSMFRNPEELFALRVQGDSMVDASVLDGDIVILRHQERAENGEMVAAWIEGDNETTLKRIYVHGKTVELRPANPNYEPKFVDADKVSVKGKVVSVIRQLE